MNTRSSYQIFILLVLLLIPTKSGSNMMFLSKQKRGENWISSNSYTDHEPILITTDINFTQQGWPGTGTEGDPFTIEDLRVASNETCIEIHNTTSHFVIKNCILMQASSITDMMSGILFKNVTDGTIQNCTISKKETGIYLENVTRCYAHNNTILHAEDWGVYAYLMNYGMITHNMIQNCTYGTGLSWYINNTLIAYNSISEYRWHGISCWGVGYNSTISHNSIGNPSISPYSSEGAIYLNGAGWSIEENEIQNDTGIRSWTYFFFYDHPQTIIRNNTFTDCQPGIDFYDVSNAVISGNDFTSGYIGIRLDYCENIVITGNAFNDQYLAAIRMGQTFNCTVKDNVLANSGLYIDGPNYSSWLHEVSGNVVNGKHLGYFISESDLQINGTGYGQIILVNCSNTEIDGGYFNKASIGIVLAFCEGCTLQNAEVLNNIYRGVSVFYSKECNFKNNSVHHNSHLYNNGGGFLLSWTVDCVFEHNRVFMNNGTGIENWLDMVNCTIINNAIYNNTEYGIAIRRGYGNIIYGNALSWNGIEVESQFVRNAWDSGNDNRWDDGVSIGNWWSDYGGEGVYNITGETGSIDHFPNTLANGTIEFPLDNQMIQDLTILRMVGILCGAGVIIILIAYYFKTKQEGGV